MANLQLILWPVDLLNRALNGAVIRESNDQRELTADDKLLMAIQYDDKTTRIRNMLQDYTMTITEVETE